METALQKALVTPTPEAVWCELAGESVILDMGSGNYFALDPIGTRIWGCLQTPSTVESLCDSLAKEYEVDSARCREDVLALLNDLAAHGLVKFQDGC